MKNKNLVTVSLIVILIFSSTIGCSAVAAQETSTSNQYSIEQAMSDNAQLSTIAFNGLAFITGSSGADTFMPPGKVADFFGFQYMRDVDIAGYGHNTTFLTKAASNVLYLLNDEQKAKLVALAKIQSPLYVNFAYNRYPIMQAFRRSLEGDLPTGSSGLDLQAVAEYTSGLYTTDAELSYNRAIVVGEIINSFTAEQKAYLAKMEFNNYATWPDVAEDETMKKSMSNTEFVAVMTYASELFSWYKGSVTADVYFCPERHGTYFGGFYMKDYPAMNNPDYFISTAITGDSGKEFLNILDTTQRASITGIIEEQRAWLTEIAEIRNTVSIELRKAITGGTVDKQEVYTLIERYGELDGQMSALYATRFSEVNKTLTESQRAQLVILRNLTVVPTGAYLFSTPVAMPEIQNTDFMFGVGTAPEDAGHAIAPTSFSSASNAVGSGVKPDVKPEDKSTQKTPLTVKKQDIRATLNGKNIIFDVPPILKNGRTLVPIRAIAEALGTIVQWNENTQTVTITKASNVVKIIMQNINAQLNGKDIELDTPAEINAGRTIVPLRFIAEAFNLDVQWDQKTMTVIMQDK
ncbi:MAG: stalk domain-containing protein [Clostridia bacterium]